MLLPLSVKGRIAGILPYYAAVTIPFVMARGCTGGARGVGKKYQRLSRTISLKGG